MKRLMSILLERIARGGRERRMIVASRSGWRWSTGPCRSVRSSLPDDTALLCHEACLRNLLHQLTHSHTFRKTSRSPRKHQKSTFSIQELLLSAPKKWLCIEMQRADKALCLALPIMRPLSACVACASVPTKLPAVCYPIMELCSNMCMYNQIPPSLCKGSAHGSMHNLEAREHRPSVGLCPWRAKRLPR